MNDDRSHNPTSALERPPRNRKKHAPLIAWGTGALLYLLFLVWYDNWSGPLSEAEIDTHVQLLQEAGAFDDAAIERVAAWLREDKGEEFVMLNLMKLPESDPAHPVTGAPTPSQELLSVYFSPFRGEMVARAVHPVLVASVAGGYMDVWNVAYDPGWQAGGFIRYPSRRDFMEMINDPRYAPVHPYKVAALESILTFPMQPSVQLVSVRLWMATLLALLCALVHLLFLRRR